MYFYLLCVAYFNINTQNVYENTMQRKNVPILDVGESNKNKVPLVREKL